MPDTATLYLVPAAKHIGLHKRTLEKLARDGKVRASKPGKRWVFKVEWLDEYLESKANSCPSSNAQTAAIGNASGASAARQLKSLLEQPTGSRRRNTTTADVLNFGGRRNSESTQSPLIRQRLHGGKNSPAPSAVQKPTAFDSGESPRNSQA